MDRLNRWSPICWSQTHVLPKNFHSIYFPVVQRPIPVQPGSGSVPFSGVPVNPALAPHNPALRFLVGVLPGGSPSPPQLPHKVLGEFLSKLFFFLNTVNLGTTGIWGVRAFLEKRTSGKKEHGYGGGEVQWYSAWEERNSLRKSRKSTQKGDGTWGGLRRSEMNAVRFWRPRWNPAAREF